MLNSEAYITNFPVVTIVHNFGQVTLRDAVWTAYPKGKEHCNPDGDNGFIVGKVVSGYSVNRLLGHSVVDHSTPGTETRFDYAAQSKLHTVGLSTPQFNLTFCG